MPSTTCRRPRTWSAVTATVPHVTANPMGDLAEWVRINRRAETEAPAGDTAAPVDRPQPVAGAPDPTGVLLPSLVALQLTGTPLLAVAVLLFVAGGLVVAIARRNRTPRSR